jgi:hypothetical protein
MRQNKHGLISKHQILKHKSSKIPIWKEETCSFIAKSLVSMALQLVKIDMDLLPKNGEIAGECGDIANILSLKS